MRFQDGLRQAHADLDALAALRAPLSVLSGTSAAAVAALEAIGIRTVFDLATSPLFALASQLTESAAGDGRNGLARFDAVPGGVGNEGAPTRPSEFIGAGLSALRSLVPSEASDLETSLGITSVGDLGRWLPYRFARLAFGDATAGTGPATDDARELVPRFGEFPTERHYYSDHRHGSRGGPNHG